MEARRLGVFDSGVGGITVLTELQRSLPETEFVYLGDTANLPYGTKSPGQIVRFSIEAAKLLLVEKVDGLVVACNSASSVALDSLRAELGALPVLGVLEPGAAAAVQARRDLDVQDAPILVLATRATVRSGAYQRAIRALQTPAEIKDCPVIEQECPLLVPIIEEGMIDHPILDLALAEYLAGHRSRSRCGVALLGCTHYPWISEAIQKALPGWRIVNSAKAVASQVAQKMGRRRELEAREVIPKAVKWIFTDPRAVPAFVTGHFRLPASG